MARAVTGCRCAIGKISCRIRVRSVRNGVTGMAIGNVPFRIRVGRPIGTDGRGIGLKKRRAMGDRGGGDSSASTTGTATTPATGPATTTTNGPIMTPLPNAVGRVGIGINSGIGTNSAIIVLRTVGVRGGVRTRASKAVANVGIGGNSTIVRKSALMAVG